MIRCFKLTGAGNNFIFIDLRDDTNRKALAQKFPKYSRARIAKELCNPFQSIGADGLVLVERSQIADVKWDFYNADGSRAEMCGNAARCMGRYLCTLSQDISTLVRLENVNLPQSFTLETRAGIIVLTVSIQKVPANFNAPISVEVEMPIVKDYSTQHKVGVNGKKFVFDFVNSGVPHAVFKLKLGSTVSDLIGNADKLAKIAHATRQLARFKKAGTNVTFYVVKNSNTIHSLTFERGVNGFTQACGTGAVAAAYSCAAGKEKILHVTVPGGKLKVDLTHNRPHLEGPANFIGEILI